MHWPKWPCPAVCPHRAHSQPPVLCLAPHRAAARRLLVPQSTGARPSPTPTTPDFTHCVAACSASNSWTVSATAASDQHNPTGPPVLLSSLAYLSAQSIVCRAWTCDYGLRLALPSAAWRHTLPPSPLSTSYVASVWRFLFAGIGVRAIIVACDMSFVFLL